MAVTLEELEAKRDKLIAQLGHGSRREQEGDAEVEWQRPSEVKAALAEIENRIAALKGTPRLREVRIASSKGF